MVRIWASAVAAGLWLGACAHAPMGPASDGRFKMVHQVSATYGAQQYLMTGYLLGRRDGSFRVSAAALVGPRLFDVARVDGQWKSKVHLKALEAKLDPRYLGLAIDRVYFRDCPGAARCAVQDDDEVDALEVDRSAAGVVTHKRFFKGGVQQLEVRYLEPELFPDGSTQARRIELHHAKYEIVIALESYQPGFAFDDALLEP